MPLQKLAWKLIVTGSKGSGKSSFISQIVYGENAPGMPRMIFKKTMARDIDGTRYSIDLLFQEMGEDNERAMSTALVMFIIVDLTDPSSLNFAEGLLKKASALRKNNIYIIGNKVDLKYEAKIWKEDLERLSGKYHSKYYMVSCKDGTGFDGLLDGIVDGILSKNAMRK